MVRYSDDQKAEALKMVDEIGAKKTQEQLGISLQTIYKWRNEAKGSEASHTSKRSKQEKKIVVSDDNVNELLGSDDGALASLEALQNENKRLMDENNALRVMNQKLKKALMSFAE